MKFWPGLPPMLIGFSLFMFGIVSLLSRTFTAGTKPMHEDVMNIKFNTSEEILYSILEIAVGFLVMRFVVCYPWPFVRLRECAHCHKNKTREKDAEGQRYCDECQGKDKKELILAEIRKEELEITCPTSGHKMKLQVSEDGIIAHECPQCQALYFSPKLARDLKKSIEG